MQELLAKLNVALDWVNQMIDKIPSNIRDIIYKAGIGVGIAAALFGVYVGMSLGNEAAPQKGLQMADSNRDLFLEARQAEAQRQMNIKEAKRMNTDIPMGGNNPGMLYRSRNQNPAVVLGKKPAVSSGGYEDYDDLYPQTQRTTSFSETRADAMNEDYSRRLKARNWQANQYGTTQSSSQGQTITLDSQAASAPATTYGQPQPQLPIQQNQPGLQKKQTTPRSKGRLRYRVLKDTPQMGIDN